MKLSVTQSKVPLCKTWLNPPLEPPLESIGLASTIPPHLVEY